MKELLSLWRDSLKEAQKKRTYRHFDAQIDLRSSVQFADVCRAIIDLKSHEFLPFIKFVRTDVRYRKGKDGRAARSIKARPIMYASHTDAHIYSFYAYKWSNAYEAFLKENHIEDSVIAYRKVLNEQDSTHSGKSNIEFAESVFQAIKEHQECDVIVVDITKFFDSLNHRILKDQLCRVLEKESLADDEYKVLRSLTAYRYVLRNSEPKKKRLNSTYSVLLANVSKIIAKKKYSTAQAVYEAGRGVIKYNRSTIGIPQGSPLSGLLANIYLASFDTEIQRRFPDVIYRRYSDDIVLVCPPGDAAHVLTELTKNLKGFQLGINPSKVFQALFRVNDKGSVICEEVRDGNGVIQGRKYLDYLGFEFDGENVLVRGRTVKKTYDRAKQRVEKFYARQGTAYRHLKPRRVNVVANGTRRSNYLAKAATVMQSVGSKIESQQKKILSRLRRQRRIGREAISTAENTGSDS